MRSANTSKGERKAQDRGRVFRSRACAAGANGRSRKSLDEAESLRPKPQLVLFAAFHFDPEAAKDIDETKWPGVELLKLQMNTDLLTDDLKKKRASNESFWLIGQPDVEVRQTEGEKTVTWWR